MHSKKFLGIELIALFIGLPVVFSLNHKGIPKSIPLLIVFIATLIYLLQSKSFSKASFELNGYRNWIFFTIRILVYLSAITILTFLFLPSDKVFYLPKHNPWLWMAIMIFYPIWSAFTQEVIYRGFFFHRYNKLIPNKKIAMTINGLLFGLLHIIFRNWIAFAGATLMGWIWASTYLKHRSLLIVSLEHALVGNYLFTIGLGYFFYVPDF